MNRLFSGLRSGFRSGEPFWASWSFILPVVIVPAVIVSLIMLVRYDYLETGFGSKTIWDWIEVLGVPLTVALIAGLLGLAAQGAGRRAEAERELATERAREATLREYLDCMSDLILNHELRESPEDSSARAVAHARTLSALRSLDGPRKGILVRFLYESNLISRIKPVVSLRSANLSLVDLSFADLEGSDLSRANLRDADFYKANLRDASLYRSALDDEQLIKATDLVGATMPDGTEMTEDRWRALKATQL